MEKSTTKRRMRLAEVVAIEKPTREASQAKLTELHKATSTPTGLTGQLRTYTPLHEDGLTFPPEPQYVKVTADDVLAQVVQVCTEAYNLTARKEYGNCVAVADVIVDDAPLLEKVPATVLLHLDKRLVDLRTLVAKFVELPAEHLWKPDQTPGVWRTDAERKQKTDKVQEALVVIPPTEFHPGQGQVIVKDRPVGYWETTKLSGAIEPARKRAILDRLQKLQNAVKVALHAANAVDAPEVELGAKLMTFVFGPAA